MALVSEISEIFPLVLLFVRSVRCSLVGFLEEGNSLSLPRISVVYEVANLQPFFKFIKSLISMLP